MFEQTRKRFQQQIQQLETSAQAADALYARAEKPRTLWQRSGQVIETVVNKELKAWQEQLREQPKPVDFMRHNDLTVQIRELSNSPEFARVQAVNLRKRSYILSRQSRNVLKRLSSWLVSQLRGLLRRVRR